ncbi:RecB family exonuclease [Epidermidibacterium keratini]|uniref:RecB family exonuclease n=1 Tax=Epidermidibacterium keratini TaxID=1891644 RepID=UPI001CEF5ED7|nr:RecB family exonuclease [Epidermidibacterium keratini]
MSETSTSTPVHSPIATEPLRASLSPSRAGDFKTCPLLYRFRSIDRLPQKPTLATSRGTVVHSVLERLFDLPQAERTIARASDLVRPAWDDLIAAEPEIAELFADDADGSGLERFLTQARALVSTYFQMEDPSRFEPSGRELLVETTVGEGEGLLLRGYVDRLDEAPDGRIRVVDYKTGAAPREAFEAKALFQMKFYALVIWRNTGTIPAQLKLMYLSEGDSLMYSPEERELLSLERQLGALWAAIERSLRAEEFRANPSKLCGWCDFKDLCPAYGGTPPPFPRERVVDVAIDRRSEGVGTD